MAIEVPVRKEIASFESRPAFGLTARQLVCFGVAIPLCVGGYFLFKYLWGTSVASSLVIFLVVPIFAFGLFKKDGYTLEKYLKIVWNHRFRPQQTVYKTENALVLYMSGEERKTDLATKMLAYQDRKTAPGQEVNITYHLTQKQERQIMLAASRECTALAKLHRKTCKARARQDKKDAARMRRECKRTWKYIMKGQKKKGPPWKILDETPLLMTHDKGGSEGGTHEQH